MPTLLVGPNSPLFRSIAEAMSAAGPGDTIQLESGYSNETATVTQSGMTVSGDASSTGIVLQLATGVALFTATGAAPIAIFDAADGSGIVGNAGDNVITVSGGVDAVDGGLGSDRLIVDYHLATGAVTGDSTSNFTEAGVGGRMVTITDGTIEDFTVLTGSGADTITTGAGNDIIEAGDGANTISAGQGANTITGGNDADTITALDGGNVIDGGNGTNIITSGGGDDTIVSGTGADTIVAGAGADQITVRGGADNLGAGAGTDRLIVDYSAMITNVSGGITGGNLSTGYVGHIADLATSLVDFQGTENFTITTGSGNDLLTTGDGVDVLSGGAGNDNLDGGAGADTAVYSGDRSDHTLTVHSDGTSTMVDNRLGSPDGTDTITGVERFVFDTGTPINIFAVPLPVNGISTTDFSSADLGAVLSPGARLAFVDGTQAVLLTDAILSVGPDTNEATIQRLYVGLLGRGNDTAGVSYWDDRLTAGDSKGTIATGFLNSPEYVAIHGTQTDANFVASLYQGLLGRAPEPAGLAVWTGSLAQGASRGEVAIGIADSDEAKLHLAPTTAQVFVPNAAGTLTHELYKTGLGREVEVAALPFYKTAFATQTLSQLAALIAASPEFAADHGGQSNDAYVSSLYQSGLGRLPEPGAVAAWTGQLNNGATRGDLLLAIATSSEAAGFLTHNLSA